MAPDLPPSDNDLSQSLSQLAIDSTPEDPPAPRCYLLELPRELRDQIYGYLHKECRVTAGRDLHKDLCAEVDMLNGPEPAMFRVCKQINHEYTETALQRLEFLFMILSMPFYANRLYVKFSFPLSLFRRANSCTLVIPASQMFQWDQVLLEHFVSSIETNQETEEDTSAREVTPSMDAASLLRANFPQLVRIVSRTCHLCFVVEFCTRAIDVVEVWIAHRILQAKAFARFSQMRNLELMFRLWVPTCAKIHLAEEAYGPDGELHVPEGYEATRTNDGREYFTRPSDTLADWYLVPCAEGRASQYPVWNGFYIARGENTIQVSG